MLRAAEGRYPVTTFQPMRPSVRWSRVDMRRANGYGCSNPVPVVRPKPRCSVTRAIAETSSIGSFTGVWAAWRMAASSLAPYTS
jgi:hypothetical protein